jgi:transcription elongation GreA/GreB family factor
VGEALLGKKMGETVIVQAPGGSIRYEIVSVQ